MAYTTNLKVPESQVKFDWDDIDVGDNHLDHSENFFARKHYEHEKLQEIEKLKQETAESDLENLSDIEQQFECFKIERLDDTVTEEKDDDKENTDPLLNDNEASIKEDVQATSLVDVETASDICKNEVEHQTQLDVTTKPAPQAKKILNLVCQWSTQKPVVSKTVVASKGAISKPMPPPPQAYLVKDIYQRKREEAEKRRLEEERKQREFHSRPVPNFNAYHEQLEKRKPGHACTVAITPQVLKKSKEAEEKRRKRLQEWKQKNQPPKFESRPPTVLKEKPFVPQKKPLVIQQTPFNLSTEKRLVERKHYDEMKYKALEEKKKQVEIEEEERKRREEERIRELRKATTFKARPNPFKH